MKLKSIAAAVIALAASSAFANVVNLGPLDNASATIGRSVSGSIFSDTYNFQLTNPGSVTGLAVSLNIGSFFNISNFTAELYSGSTLLGSIVGATPTTFSNLAAGNYALNVFGNPTGSLGGTYSGALAAVTAPVPEPETYAMMIAGLVAVGFLAGRRKQ